VVQRAPRLPRPPRRPVQGGASLDSARATPSSPAAAPSLLTPLWCWMPPVASHRPTASSAARLWCPAAAARPRALRRRPLPRLCGTPASPLLERPRCAPAGAARGRARHGQRRGGLRAHAAAAAWPPGGHRRGGPRARAAGRERGAQRRPRRPARARAGACRAAPPACAASWGRPTRGLGI